MDILNSGSFVPLDNRERIEQLIFTANTLATEVSRTEGFQSSGPTNHQLGLEMWKGAEYVCRAHEEATVRNLFLSKFLETLREIERQTVVQPTPVSPEVVKSPTVYQPNSTPVSVTPASPQVIPSEPPQELAQDEYLGVIPEEAEIVAERPSYTDECVPEFEAEIAAMKYETEPAGIIAAPSEELREDEPKDSTPSNPQEPEEHVVTDPGKPEVAEIKRSDAVREFVGDGASAETADAATTIDSIVVAEKEPYNFDSCTVTAVIQLLPGNGAIRKCVLSVRSHDFVPQISVSELAVADIITGANRLLTEAIDRYRTELPVLAAEKIKKEKPANKKHSAKTNSKSPIASPAEAETPSIPPPAAQNSEAAKDQRNLFAS